MGTGRKTENKANNRLPGDSNSGGKRPDESISTKRTSGKNTVEESHGAAVGATTESVAEQPMVGAIVRVIASEKNWIEGNAIAQLERTAQLEGMQRAVGMPDLHAGKGCPIGAAFLAKGWIYPALVGNDIGCGMGLWRTALKTTKLKLDKWAKKLHLDAPWEGDVAEWLANYDLPEDLFAASMGTIGGGNHFAELQQVETIHDAAACAALGVEKRWLYLMAHSGSRGLGHEILRSHTAQFGDQGLQANSPEASAYLTRHNQAVQWAVANRALIARRFLSALRSEGENIFDLAHNTVTPQPISKHFEQGQPPPAHALPAESLPAHTLNQQPSNDVTHWLHRKGAAPSDKGVLVIPGSRGTYSYLVQAQPTVNHEENAFSLAHGAGRKWMRSEVKARLAKYRPDDFFKTDLGGLVICEDKALMYEEAPQAYKNIDVVIQDMVEAGLITVLAVLRPVLTYKTRRRQRWRATTITGG